MLLFQISSLPIPVAYTDGAFVPNKGWIIFGGHSGSNLTQQLKSIDGNWKFGDALYQNDVDMCIVQVRNELENAMKKLHFQ